MSGATPYRAGEAAEVGAGVDAGNGEGAGDRRLTPFSGRVAATTLRGRLEAERFSDGEPMVVGRFAAFLMADPAGTRDRQLLLGEAVTAYDRRADWSFVQAAKDGYCGWMLDADLTAPGPAATHAVRTRQSHAYTAADMKRPPLCRLPFGAPLAVTDTQGRWAEIALPGGGAAWVPAGHLRPLDAPEGDPAAVAERFIGTPYLWAGNSGDGLDCSGLVQAALLACGIDCPGDSDLQAASVGRPLGATEGLARGDLLFWAGHVAMALDPATLIHANAFAMAVTTEPLAAAVDRIAAQGDGPVTARRRPVD